MAAPPAIPPMEGTDSFNPDFSTVSATGEDGALSSPVVEAAAPAPAPASPVQQRASQDTQTQQLVHEVLHSDVGVATLLNRLKASISSARVSTAACPCLLSPH
jgi:Rho GTPase-activating protein RGD1